VEDETLNLLEAGEMALVIHCLATRNRVKGGTIHTYSKLRLMDFVVIPMKTAENQ
jgi:hypothetical protein